MGSQSDLRNAGDVKVFHVTNHPRVRPMSEERRSAIEKKVRDAIAHGIVPAIDPDVHVAIGDRRVLIEGKIHTTIGKFGYTVINEEHHGSDAADQPETALRKGFSLPEAVRISQDASLAAQRGDDEAAIRTANKAFAVVLGIVPKRLADEEIGDALEYIHACLRNGGPRSLVYLKIFTTVMWILINTVRELTSAALGKKKGGS